VKIFYAPEFKTFRQKTVGVILILGTLALFSPFQNCSQIRGFESTGQNLSLSSFSSALSQSLGKSPLRRISNLEYTNSITDVIDYQFKKQNPSSALGAGCLADPNVQGALATLPGDIASLRLATNQIADSISSTRFESYIQIASAISACASKDSTTLRAFVGTCASANNNVSDAACLDNFINSFGQLAFRRSVLPIELAELKTGATQWSDIIGRILIHPRFLSHIEREGTQVQTGIYKLTAFELEARLASFFWKSIPDPTGLEAAASGKILTPDGLKKEVDRILTSTKAQEPMWNFYQQWFGSSRLQKNFNLASDPTQDPFTTFANPFTASDMNSMTAAVLDDAKQFFNYHTWQTDGSLEQIFRSPLIFTQSPALAKIYGVTARGALSDPPKTDSTGHFLGILSRPFVTQQKMTSNGVANHIQRGVLFATNFLAYQLGLPANFAEQSAAAGSVPANASSRQEATLKTASTSCMSCHSIINPSGFAFAHYDSLGRYSDTENKLVFTNLPSPATNYVTVGATNPIDSSTSLNISGSTYQIRDIPSLVDAMVSSGKLYEGFSLYYFRFAFGRLEDPIKDREILSQMSAQAKIGSVKSVLQLLATSPYFAYSQAP